MSATRHGLVVLLIFATVRARMGASPFAPIEAVAPDRVELATPRAINDSGVMAGECVVHLVRSRKDSPPAADRREHFFQQIPSVGTETIITQLYVLERGKVTVINAPSTPGGDPKVVSLNNRGQLLVSRNRQGGDRFFLCDVDSGKFVPIGLAATVDEPGGARTLRLRYLTGLNDLGEVYGVYDGPLGRCAAAGVPTLGPPDQDIPPTEPAHLRFLGSAGKGQLHIVAVNAKGQMTGVADSHFGFLWSDGILSRFSFPGATFTFPEMMNESGVVAGWFRPVNDVRDDGEVSNHAQNIGLIPPEKGFVYDGSKFRLVSVPSPGNGSADHARAINNRGDLLGDTNAKLGAEVQPSTQIHGAFTVGIDQLPVVNPMPSPADYTAEAIARRRSGPHPADGTPDSFDRAYAVLLKGAGPSAALSLRALQLLRSEKPIARPEKVIMHDDTGNLFSRSLNDFQRDATNSVDGLFFDQLALAQRTPEGAAAVVEALGMIIGNAQLDDLQAAGLLSNENIPNETNAERNARRVARRKLIEDLDTQVGAHPEPWSSALSPDKIAAWQLPEASAGKLAELVDTLNTIKDQLGNSAAGTFLACEILRREGSFLNPAEGNMRLLQIRNIREGATGATDALFVLQAMSALKQLQPRGTAEAAIRAVAKVPAPADCPGLKFLRGLGSPQSERLVDRSGLVSDDPSELLFDSLGAVERMALKPFMAGEK